MRKGETTMSFRNSLLAAVTMSILGAAGVARAQTCASDSDCPQGFACNGTTVVVPEPSCPPNTNCPRPDASAPVVVKACTPKSCNADADCGAGMVCYAQTSTACSGGSAVAPPACASDRPCPDAGAPPKPPEEMCTTTTTKSCMYRSQLPCNKDSDCGAGFTCKPSVTGSCSGSGSTGSGSTGSGGGSGSAGAPRPDPGFAPPPRDAGAAEPPPPPPPPPMCTTTTSYPGYCQPTVTTCKTDSDCPAPWKCADSPETPVSGGPATAPGSKVAIPPSPADAGAPPAKMCVNGFDTPARGGKDEGAAGGPATGNGGATSGSDTPTPATPPVASGADAGTAPAKSSSGCAMAAGPGSSGLGLGLVVAFGLLALRRRRR
jgi:MYXO-CTERM domain-containing protein